MYNTLQSAQLDKGKYVICINQMKYRTLNFYYNVAYSTSCQVHPSEYAYHRNSVNREEKPSANCRSYQQYNHPGEVHSEDFIHCDGIQLRLNDYNIGSEQYNSYAYYWWPAGRDGKLLFIFPTRVSLTTITLHYYSDSDRGLPKLSFYAVPDDFYVWNAPTTSLPHVDVAAVPPGAEPAGRRNVSINVNFNTSRVLMYKHRSSFQFAVSEVEFFTCIIYTSVLHVCVRLETSHQHRWRYYRYHDTNNISYLHDKEYASCLRSIYLLIATVCLGNALSTTQTHTSPSKLLNNYVGYLIILS